MVDGPVLGGQAGNRERLALKIRKIFATAGRPGESNLTDSLADEGMASAFAGQDWPDVSADFVVSHIGALVYFTPEAFAYYLPAVMLALLDPGVLGAHGFDLAFMLTPPTWGGGGPHFYERLDRLSRPELDVVAEWLEYADGFSPGLVGDSAHSWVPDLVAFFRQAGAETCEPSHAHPPHGS